MVRVIAGSARGARLRTPKGRSTRPTADRIKESLFAILGDVSDTAVLDLYAGTGALGIEALSRGARFALFVEKDGRATAVIRANLEHTKLDGQARIVRGEVPVDPVHLAGLSPFDLVLMDPPYDRGHVAKALAWLDQAPVLAAGARVVVERSATEELPVDLKNLRAVREKVYRETVLNFFTRERSIKT